MNGVELTKVIEKLNLENMTPDIDASEIRIKLPDINRPALQMTGYFDHFDSECRIHISGTSEQRKKTAGLRTIFIKQNSVCDLYDKNAAGRRYAQTCE